MMHKNPKIVEVTDLRCEKAVGKPGHVCHFEALIESQSMKKEDRPRKARGEGRFLKLDSGWKVVGDGILGVPDSFRLG